MKPDTREKFRKWYWTPEDRREPRSIDALAKELDVSRTTIYEWLKTVESEERPIDFGDIGDPVEWIKSQSSGLLKSVFSSAQKGNSSSQKLLMQVTGMLSEKEDKPRLELSGDDIIKRNLIAERELATGYRVEKMPDVASLLHGDVRPDPGQGETADS